MRIELSDSAITEEVKRHLTGIGIELSEYIEVFGYPKSVADMKIDPTWFSPPLPGMRDENIDYAVSVSDAESILEDKKNKAFIAHCKKNNKWGDFDDSVLLSESEADKFVEDFDRISSLFEIYADVARDDIEETLSELIAKNVDEDKAWRVSGRNLTWRGNGGQLIKVLEKPSDVLELFRSYRGYQLILEFEEDDPSCCFSISVAHHDCTSYFEFEPFVPEEKEE